MPSPLIETTSQESEVRKFTPSESGEIVTPKDVKVLEFLRYLGVDTSLSRHVVIEVPLDGPVIVTETRISKVK